MSREAVICDMLTTLQKDGQLWLEGYQSDAGKKIGSKLAAKENS